MTTLDIYTLSLHDALPISTDHGRHYATTNGDGREPSDRSAAAVHSGDRERSRSEEHTSELQSRQYLVCRLLLEKKTQPWPDGMIRPCTFPLSDSTRQTPGA